MTSHMNIFNELFECNNLITHVRKRCSVDTKEPIEVSTFINTSRVIVSLQNKLNKFFKENKTFEKRSRLAPKGLSDLITLVKTVTKYYTEDSNEIMNDAQKDAVSDAIKKIHEGILAMAGHYAFELESEDVAIVTGDNIDLDKFIKEAKGLYMENIEKQEKLQKKLKEEGREDELADISELNEYDDGDVVLGSSSNEDAPVATIENSSIISTDALTDDNK